MTFESIVNKVITNSFSSLLTEERKRDVALIGKAWDFYYGYQEQYVKQYEGEDDIDYKNKDKMVFNYTKCVIDEYIKGVFGRPVFVKFDDPKNQEIWNGIVDPIKFFQIIPFMKKVQRIAEISNTCLVMLRYDNDKKSVYFEDIRGEFVTYLPDLHNPRKIGTVIISYTFDTGIPDPAQRFVKRIEIWDDEKWEIWMHSGFLGRKKRISHGKNPYGFIPAVRFLPEEDDNTFFGLTPTNDIVTINEVYNNLWTALVRICVMQSFSILVVNTEGDLDITIAPTRFIKFEQAEKADAKYITPDPKIQEVEKVLMNLKAELQDFTKVPSYVLSSSRFVVPESGYSLQIKRIPIESLWEERRLSYGPAMKELARKAILVDEVNTNSQMSDVSDLNKSIEIEFTRTSPGLSPHEQIVTDEQDLRYGIITPVDLMLRKYPNMTREEASERLLRNKEETEKLTMSSFNSGLIEEDDSNEEIEKTDDEK